MEQGLRILEKSGIIYLILKLTQISRRSYHGFKEYQRRNPRQVFDDGEYTALFADGAVSAASGYAAGQQAYAVFQNGEAVSVKDVEKNIKVLELAAQTGCPVVTFYDSVGAKLAEGLDVLNAAAKLNATIAKVSGVVPQVAVVLASAAAPAL